MTPKKEAILLILIELALLLIIGFFLKNTLATLLLTLAYLLLFYIAFLPSVLTLNELNIIEKYLVISFLGLSIPGTLWWLLGLAKLPINTIMFVSVPILIFVVSLWYTRHKKAKN